MKFYLEHSFLFRIFRKPAGFYQNSLLNKVLSAAENWFAQSSIAAGYNRLVSKQPSFSYSLTYRSLAYIANALNKCIDRILTLIGTLGRESASIRLLKTCFELKKKDWLQLVSTAAAFYAAGFAVTKIIRNTWSAASLIFSAVILFTALLLFTLGGKLPDWFKNSSVYRLYRYIFD